MTSRLGGVLPAIITPLNADKSLQTASLEKMLARYYAAGVDGLYLCGSTGEGLSLPPDTRKLVAEICITNSPPDKQVIVHTGAETLETTLDLTRHASGLGAAAVSSLPLPGLEQSGLHTFYRDIARNSDVPVVAYYFPLFAGFELSLDQLIELSSIPGVEGIKFTDYDLYSLSTLAARGVSIFNGRDEVFAAGLLMGASGGIGSVYNVLPHSFVRLFAMAKRKEWEQARTLQFQINSLMQVLLRYPLIPAIKQALAWSGIECGPVLKGPELTPAEKLQLQQELQPFSDLLAP